MKVLIVEDDPVDQKLLTGILKKNNFMPITTGSIFDAVQSVNKFPDIELAILDIMLPDGTGKEFLDFLRKENKLAQIPVIVCSSSVEEEKVCECVEKGISDYVVKPIDTEMLIEKINNILCKRKSTVLIVDDEELMLEYISTVLRRENLFTLEARSGQEALDIFNSHNINLIISDIMMPKMNGMELLTKISENDKMVPIIMITGYSNKFGKSEALKNGATDFITKPFHNVDIINRVKSYLTKTAL